MSPRSDSISSILFINQGFRICHWVYFRIKLLTAVYFYQAAHRYRTLQPLITWPFDSVSPNLMGKTVNTEIHLDRCRISDAASLLYENAGGMTSNES